MQPHVAAGMWQCRTPAHIPFTAEQLGDNSILILHPTVSMMARVIFLISKMHTCKLYWEVNTSETAVLFRPTSLLDLFLRNVHPQTKEQLWPDFSSLLILRTGMWIFCFKKTNPFWRKNISSVGFVLFHHFWSEIQMSAYGDSLASLPSGQSCEIRAGQVLFFLLVINMYAACVLRHTCSAILIFHWSYQWKSECGEELERCHGPANVRISP